MATDRKPRLPKVPQACDTCRTRKTKCDGASPCANCVHHGFSCAFNIATHPPVPKKRKRIERPPVQLPVPPHASAVPRTPASASSAVPLSAAPTSGPAASPETDLYPDSAGIEHDLATKLDDIRVHAESREFHGASGILSFLSKLRAKARQARPHTSAQKQSESPRPQAGWPPVSSEHIFNDTAIDPANYRAISADVARLCVRAYLDNLHLIHPFIDQSIFLPHAERIVGNQSPAEIPLNHRERHFVALYYAVAALGSLTSAPDSLPVSLLTSSHPDFASTSSRGLAETFFNLAKQFLGDLFESTSLDSVSTLILLAIYCQNALRPHACYQYSGMAVRSALAIGLPSSSGPSTSQIRRCLWWSIYGHEAEMCASLGRSSALLDPHSYSIGMPSVVFDSPASIIEPMVAFAAVVGDISRQLYRLGSEGYILQRSRTTMELNSRLESWKASLSPGLHPEITNLQAPGWRLKQKVVLNLRFHNARILLHRPFLASLGATAPEPCVFDHVRLCVEASQTTIGILHNAYLNHPYFRTWWYNTTYVLYATMVILYVLLSGQSAFSDDDLLQSVRNGLDVLESMKTDVVASRCAEVVREVLVIVEQLVKERRIHHQQSLPYTLPSPEMELLVPGEVAPNFMANWTFDENLFSNLVDPQFIDGLLQADMWMNMPGTA